MKNRVADKIKIPEALWQGLKHVGISSAEVRRHSKIPLSVIHDRAPVSTAQFFSLWEVLTYISGDAAIGLRIANGLEATMMPPAFFVAYHARNLRDALHRVARFKRLCAPEELCISEQATRCDIKLNWVYAEKQTAPRALVDVTFASLLELGRTGTRTSLTPIAVSLTSPENARAVYETYYGCPVRFNANNNILSIHRKDLDKPFAHYNTEMLDILLPELESRLRQSSYGTTIAEQVKWLLRQRMTAGRPNIQGIANDLAISARSLQRKLTDEGLTFQGLASTVRHQLATEYLSDPSLSIIEIAYMLGYEDQNSFFRAFRQWEHITPSTWRIHHLSRAPIKSH